MRNVRNIVTHANLVSKLVKLNLRTDGTKIVFNYWKPGYYEMVGENKSFCPKESLISAVSSSSYPFFRGKKSSGENNDYANVIHPGHISLETYVNNVDKPVYLSVGTDGPLGLSNFSTNKNLIVSRDFSRECFGFERFPDLRLPFFSLDVEKAKQASLTILEKENQKNYNLLAEISDSEDVGMNCASAVYFCLAAAGIRNLSTTSQASLLELLFDSADTTLCMPETLAQMIQRYAKSEMENAETPILYDDFYKHVEEEKKMFQENLKKIQVNKTNDNDKENVENNQTTKVKPK